MTREKPGALVPPSPQEAAPPPPEVPPPPPEDVFTEFVSLSKDRHRLEEQRLLLQDKALELADNQDQRQFAFHSKARDQHHERSIRRSNFGRRFMWALLGTLVIVLGLLLWFLFFGSEDQRQVALQVLITLFTAFGGYGVISILVQGFRSLMGPSE